MAQRIHISVIADERGTHTSFNFKGATIGQLSMLNHEIDLLKKEILERIDASPKDFEVEDRSD